MDYLLLFFTDDMTDGMQINAQYSAICLLEKCIFYLWRLFFRIKNIFSNSEDFSHCKIDTPWGMSIRFLCLFFTDSFLRQKS